MATSHLSRVVLGSMLLVPWLGGCGPSAVRAKSSPPTDSATTRLFELSAPAPSTSAAVPAASPAASAPATTAGAATTDRSILVAAGQAGPTKIVLSESDIFWINEGKGDETGGSIMRTAKAGGPVVELAGNQVVPLGLAVDGSAAFWTSRGPSGSLTDVRAVGSILSAPLAGGPIRTLASHRPCPGAIALDATEVFFAEQGLVEGKGASISKVAKKGGQVARVHGSVQNPGGVVVTGTRIFWSSGGSCESVNGGEVAPNGAIYSADVPRGSPQALVTGLRCPEGIAVDDTAVFFTSMEDGLILRVDKSGDPATVVARDAKGARYVALDSSTIYWANQATGAIRRQAKAGGPIETLAVLKDPAGLAVDGQFVYFTDSQAGVVMKLPK